MRPPVLVTALVGSAAILGAVLVAAGGLRLLRVEDSVFMLVYGVLAAVWMFWMARKGRVYPDYRVRKWGAFAVAQTPALWLAYFVGATLVDDGWAGIEQLPKDLGEQHSFIGACFALFLVPWTWRLADHEARKARGEIPEDED